MDYFDTLMDFVTFWSFTVLFYITLICNEYIVVYSKSGQEILHQFKFCTSQIKTVHKIKEDNYYY